VTSADDRDRGIAGRHAVQPDGALMSEVRQTYGRLVHTQKTHEKEAERKVRQTWWLTAGNLIVITVTLGATLAGLLTNSRSAQWISIASAVIAFGFAVVLLSFQPQREAAEQRNAAKSFLTLRDDYARLIADATVAADTGHQVRARRDVLAARLAELHTHAPQTSHRSYKKAAAALDASEELTFSQEELDRLLPAELRGRSVDAADQ
jgi:hypothetical protein